MTLDPRCEPFVLPGTKGETIVVIHGFTGCPAHWRLVAPVLAEAGYTIVAPLLPGHGTRPEDLTGVSADDWLASVVEAALGVPGPVHLAGLSLGGLLAVLAARPVDATTITTINAPIRLRDRRAALLPLIARFRPEVDHSDQPLPDVDPEAADLFFTYRRYPTTAAVELLSLRPRVLREARRLRRPATVVQSCADETVHPSSGPRLTRALGPRARLVWLERSIHNALLGAERQRVAQAILDQVRSEEPPHRSKLDTRPGV